MTADKACRTQHIFTLYPYIPQENMADEKSGSPQLPADMKNIPAPVASRGTNHVSIHRRRAKFLKYILGGAAVLFVFHTLACGHRPHHARKEELQIADGLASHGRGRKPLRGKAAEELYL